jgi:hypothetical protein
LDLRVFKAKSALSAQSDLKETRVCKESREYKVRLDQLDLKVKWGLLEM